MKKAVLTVCLFCLLALPALCLAEDATVLRALLIGCDNFLTQQGTGDAAQTNVRMLAETLDGDARGYALIRTRVNTLATVLDFETAVSETFLAADENDLSLLYIGTHGIPGAGAEDSGLLLSDGETEELLTVSALENILKDIPGTKVLIFDFCNSGMFIGKGVAGGAEYYPFRDAAYKVLCSAGAEELSWYWQDGRDGAGTGASYFATALCAGIGKPGRRPADMNQNGDITLLEAYRYLRENCAVSTPRVYPEEDKDFKLFVYDAEEAPGRERTITDLVFDSTLLAAGQSSVSFSFTVRRETALHYQIIYYRDGAWQFSEAEYYADTEGGGLVPPGAKTRSLMLKTADNHDTGYAIIQLITVEDGFPVMQGARIISVAPSYGSLALSVDAEASFVPSLGGEIAITVRHSAPCGMTVTVLDAYGSTVRRLASSEPSRPEQADGQYSLFYWNGKKTDGSSAPEGEYTVQVKVTVGNRTFVSESDGFLLLGADDTPAPY